MWRDNLYEKNIYACDRVSSGKNFPEGRGNHAFIFTLQCVWNGREDGMRTPEVPQRRLQPPTSQSSRVSASGISS